MSRQQGADPRVVGAITGIVLVIISLVTIGLLTARDDETGLASDGIAVSEAPSATVAPSAPEPTAGSGDADPSSASPDSPDGAQEGSAGEGEGPDAAPSAPPPGPREPSDADAADFTAVVAPAGTPSRSVLADLDEDGRNEVVVASVLGGRARIDVGTWTGSAYTVSFSGEGASAEALSEVRVGDINGVPETSEVVVFSTSGTQGESLSAWGVTTEGLRPLRAIGGCWDGSNVYGIVGASLGSQRITATCDGSPAPIESWPSDIYAWDPATDAFTYERTLD